MKQNEETREEIKVVVVKNYQKNLKFIFSGEIPLFKNGIKKIKKIEFEYEKSGKFISKGYWESDNYDHHVPAVFRDMLQLNSNNVTRPWVEKFYSFTIEESVKKETLVKN